MGTYVEIGGLNTWYDERGRGEPLVLLHGGMCTNETWGAQTPAFAQSFRVLAPERRGHGHTADVEGPLTYTDMAADTIAFLEQVVGGRSHLVGWSDGGIIGLVVAIARPDLVAKLVVIGTNYDANGVAAGAEVVLAKLTPESPDMAMFRSLYEQHSPDGAQHWPVVFGKFLEMTEREPHIPLADLARIAAPTLVLVGDDDVVSLEHTLSLFRAIPGAELAVMPGTSHTAPIEKPELFNRLVLDFLEKDPVATMLPIRRAHP
jgi:pimeloyl-ACP methyl ester carboxylesterase